MKRMILCVLLFAVYASPIYSQSDTVKIWITPEQEATVFRDRAIMKAQGKKIQDQKQVIDSLGHELKKMNETIIQQRQELDRINKLLYRDSAKISALERKLKDEAKRTAGYQQLAKDLSKRLTEMKKWRGRYTALLGISVFKISIPLGLFLGGTYAIMKMIN